MTSLSPADKTELRTRMRALRRVLSRQAPEAAALAAQRLPIERLPAFAVVGGYRALGAELNPAPLIGRLTAAGARLALPRADRADAPLDFRAWDGEAALEPDSAGAPSPPRSAPLLQPDLVIVPVLAFDRRGGRLGQGGGHYDRTLANLRAAKAVFVLGLAFSGQELDHVPTLPHDQRLDAVLTDVEFIQIEG